MLFFHTQLVYVKIRNLKGIFLMTVIYYAFPLHYFLKQSIFFSYDFEDFILFISVLFWGEGQRERDL